MSIVESIASLLIPAAAGLGGVTLGARLSGRNERKRRGLDFIEKQLQELYSPLLSIRKHVRALSELRVRVATVSGNVWEELCNDARERGGVQALQQLTAERSAAFDAIIKYENEQWKGELLPSYKQMPKNFSGKVLACRRIDAGAASKAHRLYRTLGARNESDNSR